MKANWKVIANICIATHILCCWLMVLRWELFVAWLRNWHRSDKDWIEILLEAAIDVYDAALIVSLISLAVGVVSLSIQTHKERQEQWTQLKEKSNDDYRDNR